MPNRQRTTTAIAAVVLVVGGLAAVGAASPALAADTTACTVSVAELAWHADAADVEVSGGAEADADGIRLTGGVGILDPVAPVGSASFEATLTFADEEGVDTVLSNPTLVIEEGDGELLFDVQVGDEALRAQTALGAIDLRAATVSEDREVVTFRALEAATEWTAGAPASWAAATDTLDLDLTADCPASETTPSPAATGDAASDGGDGIGIPIAVVSVAVVVVALLAFGSIARRRRNTASVDDHPSL